MTVPPNIEVADIDNARIAINAPLNPGRAVAAESRPIALSTEDLAAINALATQVTAVAILAKLSADPATQTTLAAILAKIITAPATEAKQDTGNTSLASIITALATNHTDELQLHTDIATTLIAKEEAIRALLAGTLTVGTHAVTQSGTWTVQPGNTANTTAWKVDGSAVTQPSSIADAAHVTFGAKADAKSAATDTTAITAMSVWKQISASVQAIATSVAGTLTVGTHAVTGSGNFSSTVADGANVVEGALADAVVAAGASGSISAKLRAISRDIVANIVLATGSNLIGRAVADASAATGGISSIARLLSAAGASGDATNVKASAGRVYWIRGTNVRTSAVYLKLYNSASAPTAGSGTPVDTIYLPPSASFVFDFPVGVSFSAGIGFTLVTGGADNSAASVTAGDILALSIGYA